MDPVKLSTMLPPRLAKWANQFVAAELCFGVDPLLMAAIVDRESLGGDALHPPGPKGKGDRGHGHGLGQIDNRSHSSFLMAKLHDGVYAWEDPTFNILYAARLLSAGIRAFQGFAPAAIAAYNAGAGKVRRTLEQLHPDMSDLVKLAALDAITTNNYVSDVIRRRESYVVPNAS